MPGLLERLRAGLLGTSSSEPAATKDGESSTGGVFRTKRDEFVDLLEANEGRMRQSDIVSDTSWSATTVSRELQGMVDDGLVHKISVGRANLVALYGAEPDWYTPPDPTTSVVADERGTSTTDRRSILLIEDHEHEAELLRLAFEEAGVHTPIHTVRDGVDAVDFLFQRGAYEDAPTPGLVLLDLGLVDVDGIDVLRELDDRKGVHRFPVIVLSHSADPVDIHRSYEAGASGYLRKPDDLDGLIRLVEAIDGFWLADEFLHPEPVGGERNRTPSTAD